MHDITSPPRSAFVPYVLDSRPHNTLPNNITLVNGKQQYTPILVVIVFASVTRDLSSSLCLPPHCQDFHVFVQGRQRRGFPGQGHYITLRGSLPVRSSCPLAPRPPGPNTCLVSPGIGGDSRPVCANLWWLARECVLFGLHIYLCKTRNKNIFFYESSFDYYRHSYYFKHERIISNCYISFQFYLKITIIINK